MDFLVVFFVDKVWVEEILEKGKALVFFVYFGTQKGYSLIDWDDLVL